MTLPTLKLALLVPILASLCCAIAVFAQEPPTRQFVPPVPGTVVARQPVAFNGEANAHRWPAVIGKKLVGSGNGQNFYQWSLSIYALRGGAYRLRYQSPDNGGPLSHVVRANGAKLWFPVQEAKIVGAVALMRPGVQQLVIASHEMGADCGSAAVTVFATKPGGSIGPVVSVRNPCELGAAIGGDGASIELSGPYYASNAPLCCPTKPRATARLRYADGKWIESPNYFKIE